MSEPPLGRLDRPDVPALAYRLRPGRGPTVVFCTGFNSEMGGEKARAVDAWCAARGRACLRFDWSGHGASEGRLEDGTIGGWRRDLAAMIDRVVPAGRCVLVGSSMGAWIATLAAVDRPDRIAALIGIAAAPDFTEALIRPALSPEQAEALAREGRLALPTRYAGRPPVIGAALLAEARSHLLLGRRLPIDVPVRLLHGLADPDIPWQMSLRLAEAIEGQDVHLTLVKDGDHRLSRPADLALLTATLDALPAGG